jgi:hypothetical protein
VRSSTSSSKALILGLVIAFGGAAVYELYWRLEGVKPTLTDDLDRWRNVRLEAEDGAVVIGTSRGLAALPPEPLSEALGMPVHQLAILGAAPQPVLYDLAEDESFRGTVICEVTPFNFFAASGTARERTHEWVAQYRDRPYSDRVGHYLRRPVESLLAFRRRGLDGLSTLRALVKGRASTAIHQSFGDDRTFEMYFDDYPEEALEEHRTSEAGKTANYAPIEEAKLADMLHRVGMAVKQIRGRGGRVVFVRVPSSGPVREVEARVFPRAEYWERLLRTTGAPGVHFEDLPATRGVICPDHTHVKAGDAVHVATAFGTAILSELKVEKRALDP